MTDRSVIGAQMQNRGSGQTGRAFKAGKGASGKDRAAQAAARREAILNAALAEFSANGFSATRLDDVAKRAGVAKGTIYLHFADKEALFQEIVRSMLSPLVGRLEELGNVDLPLRAVIERI